MRDALAIPAINLHKSGVRFELLDGLRGIAAVVVLFAHASGHAQGTQYFQKKYLAVYFFFMLSGFVVACAYDKRMQAGMSAGQFYLRRAIRLYPLIVAGTVICVLYLIALNSGFRADPNKYAAVFFSLLALPFKYSSFNSAAFAVNPPEWSLFYELMAYAVYGAVAARLRTWHLVLGAIVSLALFAFGAYLYYGRPMGLIAHVFTASAPFTIGIILWRIYEANTFRLPSVPFWLLALILIAPCALPDSFDRGFDALIVAAVFPFVILAGAAHGDKDSGPLKRLLGDLSYPVYILHWPIVAVMPILLLGRVNLLMVSIFACAATIVFAWAAFTFYDVPVRAWLARKLLAPSRKTVAPVADLAA